MSDAFSSDGIQKRQGSYLPHWTVAGGTYFVTFRLAGSLPAFLKKEVECLRADILSASTQSGRALSVSELEALEELHFRELDILERDTGNRVLENEEVAEIIANALRHFDDERYRLFAWAIMPNHVHIVFKTLGEWQLSEILHSWKSFTANAGNKLLGSTGPFWQAESYDHLVRTEEELLRCIEYTWLNPEKAKLTGWKWRWKAPSDMVLWEE